MDIPHCVILQLSVGRDVCPGVKTLCELLWPSSVPRQVHSNIQQEYSVIKNASHVVMQCAYVIYRLSTRYNLPMLIMARKRIIGTIPITNLIISASLISPKPSMCREANSCILTYDHDVPAECGATITGASDRQVAMVTMDLSTQILGCKNHH